MSTNEPTDQCANDSFSDEIEAARAALRESPLPAVRRGHVKLKLDALAPEIFKRKEAGATHDTIVEAISRRGTVVSQPSFAAWWKAENKKRRHQSEGPGRGQSKETKERLSRAKPQVEDQKPNPFR